jgi:hypothetical protein
VTCCDYVKSDLLKQLIAMLTILAYIIAVIAILILVRLFAWMMYDLNTISYLIAKKIMEIISSGTNDFTIVIHIFVAFSVFSLAYIIFYRIHFCTRGRCIKRQEDTYTKINESENISINIV